MKTYGIFESASLYPYKISFVHEDAREPILFPNPITEEMMRTTM